MMITVTRISPGLFNGMWVYGHIDKFDFAALVPREPVRNPMFELAGYRIAKLWIHQDWHTVFNWDHGPDIKPASEEVEELIEPLCSELEERYCFGAGDRIQLVHSDNFNSVEPGTQGTVSKLFYHHDRLRVYVDFANRRQLTLTLPPDTVTVVHRY